MAKRHKMEKYSLLLNVEFHLWQKEPVVFFRSHETITSKHYLRTNGGCQLNKLNFKRPGRHICHWPCPVLHGQLVFVRRGFQSAGCNKRMHHLDLRSFVGSCGDPYLVMWWPVSGHAVTRIWSCGDKRLVMRWPVSGHPMTKYWSWFWSSGCV